MADPPRSESGGGASTAGDRVLLARLAALPPVERDRVRGQLTMRELDNVGHRWALHAHAGQLAPPGDWRVWLIRAGRGFGKTRAGAEWVGEMVRTMPGARVALVGATIEDAARVMVAGPSGVLATARDGDAPVWRPTSGIVRWANGAEARVYAATAPEKLRGPEHHFAWCDELGKWRAGTGEAAWDNLTMTMRIGERPRVLVTTTPRPTKLMRRVMALPSCVETVGRTGDNPHLPASFVDAMAADYGATRLGRQELDGELLDDAEGTLWPRALIEQQRRALAGAPVRVVVGVDPPASATGDACGIVAVALGADDCGYVIEDASVSGASPERWARAVASCAERNGADRVVAEANQGGDMVVRVLHVAAPGLAVAKVHASRGKAARAEPVAMLYEAGRVWHAAPFPALEDELAGLVVGGGYAGPGRSPDRADACVWALTELMLSRRGAVAVRGV